MVYFRKYFGKCALTAHFTPQTTPQSPTNDLPTTRSPMLLPPPFSSPLPMRLLEGQKVTSTGQTSDQYWSQHEAVVVDISYQYWSRRRPVLVRIPLSSSCRDSLSL